MLSIHICLHGTLINYHAGWVNCNTRCPLFWTYKERSFRHSWVRWLMGSMSISLSFAYQFLPHWTLSDSVIFMKSSTPSVYLGIWTKWRCWICSESVEGAVSLSNLWLNINAFVSFVNYLQIVISTGQSQSDWSNNSNTKSITTFLVKLIRLIV